VYVLFLLQLDWRYPAGICELEAANIASCSIKSGIFAILNSRSWRKAV
jgi:hypothetical protein